MRLPRRLRAVSMLALTAGLGVVSAAHAGLVYTAPLPDVARQSSHVALVELDRDTKRFRVERWYRGKWPGSDVEIHGWPRYLVFRLLRPGTQSFDAYRWRGGEPEAITDRMFVFLEEHDGRLHFTGPRRYGGKVTRHSSVRLLTETGRPVALRQVVNPGSPVPAGAEEGTFERMEAYIRGLLAGRAYEAPPGGRPALREAHRVAFYAIVDPVIDGYAGDLRKDVDPDVAFDVVAKLDAWMDRVPRGERLHALDAMTILARSRPLIPGGAREILEHVALRLEDVDREAAVAWVLRELRHGGHPLDHGALTHLARRLGVSEEAQRALEARRAAEEASRSGDD